MVNWTFFKRTHQPIFFPCSWRVAWTFCYAVGNRHFNKKLNQVAWNIFIMTELDDVFNLMAILLLQVHSFDVKSDLYTYKSYSYSWGWMNVSPCINLGIYQLIVITLNVAWCRTLHKICYWLLDHPRILMV